MPLKSERRTVLDQGSPSCGLHLPERLGIVDQFFHNLPVQDSSGYLLGGLKGFGQEGCIAGVLHIQIALVDEEVEQGFELGISETPGGFGTIPCHLLQELENLI